ncbi:Ras-like GTP-binding protein Rho1 [Orchesella cincta]|uniref:Ras-like GTP-binding protein Rho1 n=1 Tax=Orchesella cincta TaxID=48709 RepID=A0A1D2M262_ORCCI|nr:Ras-like GTP-binding protein Rho1 [Orchesella cincta]
MLIGGRWGRRLWQNLTSVNIYRNQFPETYVPTEFDISTAQMKLDGNQVELTIRDTSGQEDYDRLRPLSYPNSNAVLVCFAVDAPDSLENVAEKWSPEIQYYCRGIPVILVGNKMDLRDDPNTIHKLSKKQQEPVTFADAVWVAQKIGAQAYLECSAKSGERVQNVFETAAKVALQLQSPKPLAPSKKKCGGCCRIS